MKTIFAATLLMCSSAAFASGTGPGTLRLVHTKSNGVIVVYTSGTRTGSVPGCALATYQAGQNRFAFDSTTLPGRSLMASLLAAYHSETQVNIGGTGTCDAEGDTETISVIITAD
jgi:hypothetical protein